MKKLLLLFLSISLMTAVLSGCDWRDIFRGQGNRPVTSTSASNTNTKPIPSTIEFDVVTPTMLEEIEKAEYTADLEEYTNLVKVIKRIRKSVVKVFSGEKLLAHGVVIGKSQTTNKKTSQENSANETETVDNVVVSYIATSHALVAKSAEIQIESDEGSSINAFLVGSDPDSDLCLLCVEADLSPVEFYNDTALLEVGESVVSIGDMLGTEGGTATKGIISAQTLKVNSYGYSFNILSTDTMINEGSYGGGLFTSTGFFIGMVSSAFGKYFPTPGKMNFALSASDILNFSNQFTKNSDGEALGYIEGKYMLGIECKDEYANRWGTQINVVVTTAKEDGCCYIAGLRAGDLIKTVEYKGKVFVASRTADLYDYINSTEFSVGDVLTFSISRGDTSRTIQVLIKQYIYQN